MLRRQLDWIEITITPTQHPRQCMSIYSWSDVYDYRYESCVQVARVGEDNT